MMGRFLYYFPFLLLVFTCFYCSAPYPRFTSEDFEKSKEEEKKEDNVIVELSIEPLPEKEINEKIDSREVVNLVKKYIGTPYKYGGKSESGFDCSGFTSFIYEKSVNIKLPPSSVDQYKLGEKIEKNDLIFGDLVFFNTNGRIPSHVGIYIGNDKFVHSSVQRGVTISSLNSTYYKKRYVGARRLILPWFNI